MRGNSNANCNDEEISTADMFILPFSMSSALNIKKYTTFSTFIVTFRQE